MKNSKKTVEEKIGKAYREWCTGDCIIIDAPTGSGKTTFVLKTLLPYYCGQEKKILYLVNRRILKEQIEEMVTELPHEQYAAIKIELYQEIEKRIVTTQCNGEVDTSLNHGYNYGLLEKFSDYDCVVCDECHYFLADSNYNTNTIFSFRWVQDVFRDKLCIFMSATIHELQSYIEKINLFDGEYIDTVYYRLRKYAPTLEWLTRKLRKSLGYEDENNGKIIRNVKHYPIDRDYSYIEANNIGILKNRKDVVDLVAEGKSKWLIFVDNINFGKALKNSISRKLRELAKKDLPESIDSKVIMISSGYKRDQDSNEEVERIIRTSASSAKVLIVTSVLDNGVNIKDLELRNVILFADTETELIQMLGRKRKDTQQLKLYIYGYEKNHFCKRKQQLKRKKKIVDPYLLYIEKKIADLKKADGTRSWDDEVNVHKLIEIEEKCIEYQHKKIMQQIFDNYIEYRDVRSVFTVYDGTWHLNLLSFQNIENLICYYQSIIEKFEEEGEDAFAREQLRWLGKTGEEAEKIIIESRNNREEKCRNKVKVALDEIVGQKKTDKEFAKFTDGIIDELRVVAKFPLENPSDYDSNKAWETCQKAFVRKGKAISKQSMEFLCAYCGIPFRVENDRKGGYTVQHASDNKK